MRYPAIRQHDAADCGPAALATVAAFHGKHLSLAKLREAASTDRRGTTVAGVMAAAERAGFTARAVRATAESLEQVRLPAIAHWQEHNRNHFVVLYKVTSKTVTIADPACGIRQMAPGAFRKHWSGVLVLLTPSSQIHALTQAPPSFVRLCGFILPHRRLFLGALFAAVLITLLTLTSSFFIQALLDIVFVQRSRLALKWLTLGMLAALLARTAFQGLRSYLLTLLSLRIDAETVLGFHRHLLGLPLSFFSRRKTGEILSRLGDAAKIRTAVSAVALSIVIDALFVLVGGAAMACLDWRLTLLSLGPLPLLLAAVWIFNIPIRRCHRLGMEKAAEVETQILESIGAIQTIKAFRVEGLVQVRTEARFDDLLEASYRSQLLALGSGLTSSLFLGLTTILVLWMGGHGVLDGATTIGQLMAFYTLAVTILGPIERLAHAHPAIVEALVAAGRIGEILELETETSRPSALDRPLAGSISFTSVACRYGARPPVFENFSLEVAPGECVSIAGESGCGKTTLVNLLGRFMEPSGGSVRIDGVDVRDYSLQCLRREIAYVLQDVVLLHGSIADNIRLGRPAATPEEVRRAGCEAGVDAFADRLPMGYDTLVGEGGLLLSGGERQRVALARAILADAPILVLDEPTNHLDAASATAVQRIIDRRRGRATTIVISHRSLEVDRIVALPS